MGRAAGKAFQAQGTASAKPLSREPADRSVQTFEVFCGESIISDRVAQGMGSHLTFRLTTWGWSVNGLLPVYRWWK